MSDRTLRGLIVEDEGLTVMLLRSVFASVGYQIAAIAGNGEHAIEAARHRLPDFIVMDINMPGMNGIEATRRIMAERPVPIIMLTAYSATEFIDASLQAGACGYVTKPVTRGELVKAVQEGIAAFAEGHKAAPVLHQE